MKSEGNIGVGLLPSKKLYVADNVCDSFLVELKLVLISTPITLNTAYGIYGKKCRS